MTEEDAKYYAKHLCDVERAIMLASDSSTPTLLYGVADSIGCEASVVRASADHLQSMNLLSIKQSRLGGQFFHNYVILNDRGLQVQALLTKKK